MKLKGTWHITEMEMWDEDYFNMETQAFIRVNEDGSGEFQFGLVSGHIDGDFILEGTDEKLEFTWDGNEECDPASGSGWLKLKGTDTNTLKGKFKFHMGERSKFYAMRAK